MSLFTSYKMNKRFERVLSILKIIFNYTYEIIIMLIFTWRYLKKPDYFHNRLKALQKKKRKKEEEEKKAVNSYK